MYKEERMLYVKVPKEIKEYEEKMIAGLSTRQLLWGLLAIISSVVSYFLFSLIIGSEIASWITIFIGIPLFACGFIDYQGMPMSKFIKVFFNYYSKKQLLLYENECIDMEDNEYEKTFSRKQKRNAAKERKNLREDQDF